MKRQVREVGEDIEALMESDQNQEAWKILSHWYRQPSGGKAPPSQERLDSIETKRISKGAGHLRVSGSP